MALSLFTPLLLLLSLLIRIKIGPSVNFQQTRPGINFKPFTFYKFRSMLDLRDGDGKLLSNEERLTNFGKKLRHTSLDELPSIINVLKGDMSFVGPRPLRMRYKDYFNKEQNLRHTVKPGLTGYAQINGRSNISWDQKIDFDIFYIKNQSLYLDIKIMIQTIFKVILLKDTKPQDANFEIPFDEYVIMKNREK